MNSHSHAPFAAQMRSVMACALCSTMLTVLAAPSLRAEEPTACDPATSECAAPQAEADIILPPVEVTAAAPEAPKPAPRRATPRRAAPRVAAPAPAAAPVATEPVNPESRFASRPARVLDRTAIGHLTVDTPLTGTTISAKEIESVRSTAAETDLLQRVPGISMVRNIRIPTGGAAYTNNLIDGFAVRSQRLGKVGFLDEVNMWDTEAIEITRGPASVLYASKAVGGTINVISRKPPESREGEVFLEGGTSEFVRAGLNLAGPVGGSGKLSYSLSANTLQSDGWRDRSAIERSAISGKLVWELSEATELTLRAERLWYYEEHPGRLTQAQFDADWKQPQYRNLYEDNITDNLSAVLKHRISANSTLELSYGYSLTEGIDACLSGCSSSRASVTQGVNDYTNHNLRAVYTLDLAAMDTRLSFGVDAVHSRKIEEIWSRGMNSFTPIALLNAYTIDETSVAPFAQAEFSPVQDVRVTLGARWENYELDVDDRSPVPYLDDTKTYSELVTKAGATWEFAPDHLLWASVAEGFYVPSTTSTVSTANPADLPPESSLTYSLGLRGELRDGAFGYDVGLYHSTIKDQETRLLCGGDAVLCPGDPAGVYAVAAGEVRYRGVETSLFWRVSPKLRFDLSHTYAQNTYIDFVDSSGSYSGNTIEASPKHHVNLRASFTPTESWNLEAEADWISSYFTNASNTDSYQRPWLVTLRTSYALNDRVGIYATMENAFDEKYASRVSSTEGLAPVRGYNEGYSERTFRVGLSAKF